jgi:hypothetical protein
MEMAPGGAAPPFQKLDFLRAIWPDGNREKVMGRVRGHARIHFLLDLKKRIFEKMDTQISHLNVDDRKIY